jgi:hypothetical protein
MSIASIGDKKEKNDVSKYLDYIGVSTDVVFSALDKLAGEGSVFDGWGKDESVPKGDCPATFEGGMYNTSCEKESLFACEEKPYTGPSTPPP